MKEAVKWFEDRNWTPFAFQKQTWKAISAGRSGLLNSPTGSGKTYALWFGVLANYYSEERPKNNLHCLWITPLRALSKEILLATQQVSKDLSLDYRIALRTGDTGSAERARQKKKVPQALITTPESVHLLMASKGYDKFFSGLEFIIVDEWHELMGSKRGVMVELAVSRLRSLCPKLKIWGISATINNLIEAKEILLGPQSRDAVIVRAEIEKQISIETLYPDVIEKFSWAGHLGIQLLPKIIPIVEASTSTLIFVNVRSQAEIWYQKLIEAAPQFAGQVAVHHGSLSENIRKWVEDQLHKGNLKAVIATSSLDLGVDFRTVDTVIQIGSTKGIARFMQRAGRSGHQPGALSRSYFVPTNSLEILEGSALKYAIANHVIEDRIPFIRSFDVLVQYMVTLAVSEGFRPDELFEEARSTHCFSSMTRDEFNWCLNFITTGGSLYAYDDYHKVVAENGLYKVTNRQIATRHRLSIGTIVSDSMMSIKMLGGKRIGMVEEWFISRLQPGDVFWFGGKNLEVVWVKEMEVRVRSSKKKGGKAPSFLGGRLPLSSQLSQCIRKQIHEYKHGVLLYDELHKLAPLLELQKKVSYLPDEDELLIEQTETRYGYHTFIYPFEGRFVHEGMAAILAYRIGLLEPFTFSMGMNDYGFELLSDKPLDIDMVLDNNLFSQEFIYDDALKSVNAIEMAKRRFRDIATISGLVFTGYPGKEKKTRHLQASSQLFFKVFEDVDHHNLLLRQAYNEALDFQLEITRMQRAFSNINAGKIILRFPEKPSPFAFPVLVDTLRERFTNEDVQVRIDRMLKSVKA